MATRSSRGRGSSELLRSTRNQILPSYADDYSRALQAAGRGGFARDWFKLVSGLYPSSAELKYKYGLFLDSLSDKQSALAQFRQCAEMLTTQKTCSWEAGQILFYLKRYEEALREYREVIRLDSTESRGLYERRCRALQPREGGRGGALQSSLLGIGPP